MARKKKADEGGGGANWMDTYGDLVTLLLCFFVLLYASSSMDAAKFDAMASSMRNAFGSAGGSQAFVIISSSDTEEILQEPIQKEGPYYDEAKEPTEGDEEEEGDGESQELLLLASMLESYLDENSLAGEVIADHDAMSLVIRFRDNIFFDSGSATIREEAYEVLNRMALLFVEHADFINTIQVEGHTDNVPLRAGSAYRDNLELSSIRGTNAWRYILETGLIEPERITGVGRGEFRPIDTNDTAEGRQNNRRVDFVIDSINVTALRALAGMAELDG